ncbi:hypothetical protein X927_05455 [Petrotoga mexicana DSM 14811]|uniref:Thiamin/hydroxymethyl pyrimidine-binding YkoF putative domain-containing protein n=1 Tax=Petrotoga mexicana DSM 14811 TaxID=1122954 RepID=A0A2K1P9L9_9BACT|nr:YkoF family thiamine/hydroxymethylpyrimidine-binding protein [Petrotoga mexicana]PNR99480.1 hypothetical protein X927_05455 [Petrotoga mexicana DSM 14811]
MLDGTNKETKKVSEYSCSMALYPLGTDDYVRIISDAIIKLRELQNIEITVGKTNTVVKGSKEDIFKAINLLIEEAQKRGTFALTITISNVCGLT